MYADGGRLEKASVFYGIYQAALGIAYDNLAVECGIKVQSLVAVLIEHDGGAGAIGNGEGNVLRRDGTGGECKECRSYEGEDFLHER